MSILELLYRGIRHTKRVVMRKVDFICTWITFHANGVEFASFRTGGRPCVIIARGGSMHIGKKFAMNNGIKHNPIGAPQPCVFFVDKNCCLSIGENVGISQTALVAKDNLTIGNNVKIGGGTCVYTTDFHSLDAQVRASSDDSKYSKKAPVVIEDNVFVGAKSIILKGVTIGRNSIVGAGSVVTKSIPANEIWAGNPARFIRKI